MYKRETCPLLGRQFRTVDVDASPAAYLLNVLITLFYTYMYIYYLKMLL